MRRLRSALLFVLLTCGGAPGAADMSKTLRVAFPVDVTGFDPQVSQDLYSGYIERSVFDTLLTYDHLVRPYRLIPNTAAALPEVRDGGRTIIVRLQRGIHFAPDPAFGGKRRELTADDYVFSWKRIIDPAVASPNLFIFEDKLVGAEALVAAAKKTGKFDYDAKLEGLQALDRYTLQLKLKNPDFGILDYMTTTQLSAVAREVVAMYGTKPNTWTHDHPVGTGPYYLKEWRRGSKLILEANPEFRDVLFPDQGEPGDTALIKAYKGRQLPLVGRIDVAIIEESNPRLLAFTYSSFSLPLSMTWLTRSVGMYR